MQGDYSQLLACYFLEKRLWSLEVLENMLVESGGVAAYRSSIYFFQWFRIFNIAMMDHLATFSSIEKHPNYAVRTFERDI